MARIDETLKNMVDQVAYRMGLDPVALLDTEKNAIVSALQFAVRTAWEHYPWPDVLEVTHTNHNNGQVGISSVIGEIDGIFKSDPRTSPNQSSLRFTTQGTNIYIHEAPVGAVYILYYPKAPSYDPTIDFSTQTAPYILSRYATYRAYGEMLLSDGQHDKAALIFAEAEKILYQEVDKAQRTLNQSPRNYADSTQTRRN